MQPDSGHSTLHRTQPCVVPPNPSEYSALPYPILPYPVLPNPSQPPQVRGADKWKRPALLSDGPGSRWTAPFPPPGIAFCCLPYQLCPAFRRQVSFCGCNVSYPILSILPTQSHLPIKTKPHAQVQDADKWKRLALLSDELGFKRQAIYCWTKVGGAQRAVT